MPRPAATTVDQAPSLESVDLDSLDATLATLAEHRQRWARLPIWDKINYLGEIRSLVVRHAEEWARVGAAFKGFDADHPSVGGEEWLGGPYPTVAWISDAMTTLEALRTGRDPLAGLPLTTRPDGQLVLRVMPGSIYDRLLLSGYELDVWMEPGVTAASMRAGTGSFYAQADPPGRVCAVLGAGNVSSIPVLDVLTSMFTAGDVVALKLNPISEAYGSVIEAIFAPLIRDGYLRVLRGGGELGARLVHHETVEAVHITGSERTFDAIVWGTGEEAAARRARREPLLSKPITSELGGVGPTIIVPGAWSRADLEYQAEHIATQKLHSSGHTCVASQVLVLPASWPQRAEFVAAVRRALARAPHRRPFYPGADRRLEAFLAEHPQAELLDGHQQVAILEDVDPTSDHPAFREEFFGPQYVTTTLPGDDVETYLAAAVSFANTRLAGNLGANLLVDPSTARAHEAALDRAVAELRYGCIGVNAWAGVVFLSSRGAWGAYAGNTLDDIRSGAGVVHNSLMLDHPQKNVIWAPFRPFPRSARHGGLTIAVKPPWFVGNETSVSTARQFTLFAADPHPRRLPRLFASALRG
jgi:aldehyde dehydrogenase (NAD(P)+)